MNLTCTLKHHRREDSAASVRITKPGRYWSRFKSGRELTMGMHVFAAEAPEWIYGVIRISNGVVGRDGKGFCGTVYAESLAVTIDGRAAILELAKFGREPIIFRPRGVLEIPFLWNKFSGTIQPSKDVYDLLHCRIKPEVQSPGYGPTNSKQPAINQREFGIFYGNYLAGMNLVYAGVLDVYTNPGENIAVEYRRCGPYTVEGYANGYAHGGFGIDPCHGWEMVPEATEYHADMHRANMHRQFCDALDAQTGDPISLYAWNKPPGRDLMKGEAGRESEVELLCFLVGDYEHRRYPSWNVPSITPSYSSALWSYRPNDLAHIIRVLRHTIPVIEYGGRSPAAMCARFDLLMIAEDARYQQWSDRTDELVQPSYPGEWVPNTLARVLQDPPGHGHPRLERQAAWMAYLGACVQKYFQRPANWSDWSRNMLTAILRHQDPMGFSHRDWGNVGAFPAGGKGTQTFHSGLLGIGTFALWLQSADTTRWPEAIERMAEAMYCTHEPISYGAGYQWGPAHWLMTEQNGQELARPEPHGEGDPAHVLAFMALMARGPRRDFWLDRSLKFNVPHSSHFARLEWFKSCKDRSWTAEMHSVMEQRA